MRMKRGRFLVWLCLWLCFRVGDREKKLAGKEASEIVRARKSKGQLNENWANHKNME